MGGKKRGGGAELDGLQDPGRQREESRLITGNPSSLLLLLWCSWLCGSFVSVGTAAVNVSEL